MDNHQTKSRERAVSHLEYLSTLHPPSENEQKRISGIQEVRELDNQSKYHTAEEHEAATKIQKAYRGHRGRRTLDGLVLDPSSRWLELFKEWRYRTATAPHDRSSLSDGERRLRAPSDLSRVNWRRAGQIAGHAAERSPPPRPPTDPLAIESMDESETVSSLILDQRSFLEMVDQKHRYGANLQVYHEVWQRSKTDQNFFHWLDHGDGKRVELPLCSREKLENERVRYLGKEERNDYLVRVDETGKLRWAKDGELITSSGERYQDSMHGIVPKGSAKVVFEDDSVRRQLSDDLHFSQQIASDNNLFPDATFELDETSDNVDSDSNDIDPSHSAGDAKIKSNLRHFHVSPGTILNSLLRASVKPGRWIYVADTVGRLYVGIKSPGTFQHTSFLSGARISSAGWIGIEGGYLTFLSPLSGHYRPTTKSFRLFVENLKGQGADLSRLKVSKAYKVLLSMEYYGKSKQEMRRMIKHEKIEDTPSKTSAPEHVSKEPRPVTPATAKPANEVGNLMDALQIQPVSPEGKR